MTPRPARFGKRLLAVGLLLALLPALAFVGPRPAHTGAQGGDLPPDLALVPPDALAFVHIQVADWIDRSAGQMLRQQLSADRQAKLIQEMTRRQGVSLFDVDRLTYVEVAPSLHSDPFAAAIVLTRKPYDRAKVRQALVPDATDEGDVLVSERRRQAVSFVNDRLYIVGIPEAVTQLRRGAGGAGRAGPQMAALRKGAAKHQVVIGVHLSEEVAAGLKQMIAPRGDEARAHVPAYVTSFQWLLDLHTAVATFDLRDNVDVSLDLTFREEGVARRGLRLVHAGVLAAQMACNAARTTLAANLGRGGPKLPATLKTLQALEDLFDRTAVEQHGKTVRATLKGPLPPDFAASVVEVTTQLRSAADRMLGGSNLRQCVIAMHNYHVDYQKLPPSAIVSKDGKPLLSWRVAILPYIEQDNLYRQFKLDEPWDSDHNKKLLAQMPKIYASPGAQASEPFTTYYQVFVAAPAYRGKYVPVFDLNPKNSISLGQLSVQDGTSNTIAVIEADRAVPWTKPEDVVIDAMIEDEAKPLPKFGGGHPEEDTFLVAFSDGSVRSIKKSLADAKQYKRLLRQLIGRKDGENEDIAPIIKD
jgi:hypothetical protein